MSENDERIAADDGEALDYLGDRPSTNAEAIADEQSNVVPLTPRAPKDCPCGKCGPTGYLFTTGDDCA